MRRLLILLYALIFVDEVVLVSLVPLLPSYRDAFSLSGFESGVALSAASLAIVAGAIPGGVAGDRPAAGRLLPGPGARRRPLDAGRRPARLRRRLGRDLVGRPVVAVRLRRRGSARRRRRRDRGGRPGWDGRPGLRGRPGRPGQPRCAVPDPGRRFAGAGSRARLRRPR